MPEPHATTAGVIAGSSVGAAASYMGADPIALVLGMAAAILVSIGLTEIDKWWKSSAVVGLATLVAAYAPPVLAGLLVAQKPGFTDGSPLRYLLAILIGAVIPVGAPIALRWAEARWGGKS